MIYNGKRLSNLNDLNNVLFKLKPQITGISLDMLEIRGASLKLLDLAIRSSNGQIYDGMKRSDVLKELRPTLATIVERHDISDFRYDPHGDKHFPGGPQGTKFIGLKDTVNYKIRGIIAGYVGRIRRNARGKNQTYYLTHNGISECPQGHNLTIQVDFNYAADSITYHGYPDGNVNVTGLSKTKGGTPLL